jgi:hypothetical protein
MEYSRYKTLHFSFLPICLCFSSDSRTSFTRLTHLFPHLIFFYSIIELVLVLCITESLLTQRWAIINQLQYQICMHMTTSVTWSSTKLFKPRYSWNIAKVGVKHQSINDHHQFIYSNLCFFRKLNTCCIL